MRSEGGRRTSFEWGLVRVGRNRGKGLGGAPRRGLWLLRGWGLECSCRGWERRGGAVGKCTWLGRGDGKWSIGGCIS